MSFANLDIRSVQENRPQYQTVRDSQVLPTHTAEYDRASNFSSARDTPSPGSASNSSPAETVVRWKSSPLRSRTPQGSSAQSTHESPLQTRYERSESFQSQHPGGQFDEAQIKGTEADAAKREAIEEDNMYDRSATTPSNDDTIPYVRYAIEQLTKDDQHSSSTNRPTNRTNDSYTVARILPDLGPEYIRGSHHTREELALARKHRSTPSGNYATTRNDRSWPLAPEALTPTTFASRPPAWSHQQVQDRGAEDQEPMLLGINNSEVFIPVETPPNTTRYPSLTFVPAMLRPLSLSILALLCLFMAAALAFCAIYSSYHTGLLPFTEGLSGVRYFLFGFVPQILAAVIFAYIQCVLNALTRILPYTMMAMDDAESRANALFLDLFPGSMMWPRWDGPVGVDVAGALLWLTVFTIPLQACAFAVVLGDGVWLWTAVQGVAWTLVALYVLAFMGTVVLMVFFHNRTTGLRWDPRSLADVMAMLPRSNALKDYSGTELMKKKQEIRNKLLLRSDRLGYWRTPETKQGLFYCLGETGAPIRRYTLESGKIRERTKSQVEDYATDVEGMHSSRTRFRHLPWFLSDIFVLTWSLVALVLFVALCIVAFLPKTSISHGFSPLVKASPDAAGFSPANFLYSFIPSALGMLLFLLLQPLDFAVRKLQPWAELGYSNGAIAESSLLLDYPACFPFQITYKAISNGHLRIAILSATSTLSLILPILAGGLFFPLTAPTGNVLMFPSLPAFYVILAVLVLYLLSLLILVPGRGKLRMPHDVGCLAEVISFVHASHVLNDAPFQGLRSKQDLRARLGGLRDRIGGGRARYRFGMVRGRWGREALGVERLGRR